MYIQITTRCNMTCAHCCMRATAKGDDMGRDTFFKAAVLAESYGECITIGGGEPTLHPKLFDFIGIGLSLTDYQQIHVITNGKLKVPAFKLAKMAREGIIGAELSRDEWHDPIDYNVVQAFTKKERYAIDSRDLRGIRTVTSIVHIGRAADNEISTNLTDCACDDLFVAPDGTIWACVHKEDQFGTVFEPDIPAGYIGCDYKCSQKASGWDEEEEEDAALELVEA